MLTKQDVLEYLKNHKQYFHDHYGLEKIGLFGSFARGDYSTSSDVDILFEVDAKKKFSMEPLANSTKQASQYLLNSIF